MQNLLKRGRFGLGGVALLLLLSFLLWPARPVQAGQWVYGSYTNTWGQRYYQVYVPSGYRAGTAVPLVVMLHGCLETPDDFAAGTRMNSLAEANNFIVLYPQEGYINNSTLCWNWFYTINQARGTGEPSIIAGMVSTVKSQYSINSHRVYIAGMSAGAAMTSIMASCYSDVFAAAAVHSGLEYEAASTPYTAPGAMSYGGYTDPNSAGYDAYYYCSGAPGRLMPVIVFHGSSDSTVNPANGSQVISQFAQMNDYADDSSNNDSVRASATSSSSGSVAGGYSYNVYNYNYAGRLLLQKYVINGMGHAWSGGNGSYAYNDPGGPNASQIIWNFFSANTR